MSYTVHDFPLLSFSCLGGPKLRGTLRPIWSYSWSGNSFSSGISTISCVQILIKTLVPTLLSNVFTTKAGLGVIIIPPSSSISPGLGPF